jgi:transposase
MFVVVVEISTFEFCSHFLFFVSAQPIMPGVSNKRWRSRSAHASKKRKERLANSWRNQEEVFSDFCQEIKNPNGRSRTLEENKLLIFALRAYLHKKVESMNEGHSPASSITWTLVETEVARDFCVRREHLTELRRVFVDEGDVVIFGKENARGGAAEKYDHSTQQKVSSEHLIEMIKFIDQQHSEGRSVTNRKVQNWFQQVLGITMSRRTIQRKLQATGLSWSKVKPRKRTLASFRLKAIRDFLISLDNYVRAIQNGNPEGLVLVFTDESYVHNTHALDHSYLQKGKEHIERSRSKGRRLIILHAITTNGPLAERDENGMPVDDLKWNGDTCHPTPRADGKITCETLWVAQSSTGDYHDNMNSEMFMQWVETKLVPTFERQYPGKKMVLVADNAAYHHKRVIGSLASLSKKKLIEMMTKYEVDYLDLPLTESRFEFINEEDERIEDRGDCIRISFDPEEQQQTASQSKPFVANTQELKVAFVTFLKENRPDLLECKVEKFLHEHGHKVLWTPPYCPELQPIEMFWAAGKNHAALMFYDKRTMKEMVSHVREGWNGNGETYPVGDLYRKAPVDCEKLYQESIKAAATKFIPLCEGISGTIGALTIDPTYQDDEVDIPIDALVLGLTQIAEEGGDPVDQL